MSKKITPIPSANKFKKKELIPLVTDFLSQNNDKQFNYKQIAAALGVRGEEGRRVLISVLNLSSTDRKSTRLNSSH